MPLPLSSPRPVPDGHDILAQVRPGRPRRALSPIPAARDRARRLPQPAVHPEVGLIFLVPGVTWTLRVVGRRSSFATRRSAQFAMNGRLPEHVLVVGVERVLAQCPNAWSDPASGGRMAGPTRPRSKPTLAETLIAHAGFAESVEALPRRRSLPAPATTSTSSRGTIAPGKPMTARRRVPGRQAVRLRQPAHQRAEITAVEAVARRGRVDHAGRRGKCRQRPRRPERQRPLGAALQRAARTPAAAAAPAPPPLPPRRIAPARRRATAARHR